MLKTVEHVVSCSFRTPNNRRKITFVRPRSQKYLKQSELISADVMRYLVRMDRMLWFFICLAWYKRTSYPEGITSYLERYIHVFRSKRGICDERIVNLGHFTNMAKNCGRKNEERWAMESTWSSEKLCGHLYGTLRLCPNFLARYGKKRVTITSVYFGRHKRQILIEQFSVENSEVFI